MLSIRANTIKEVYRELRQGLFLDDGGGSCGWHILHVLTAAMGGKQLQSILKEKKREKYCFRLTSTGCETWEAIY